MRIAGSNSIIATDPIPGNLRVWSGILLLIPNLFAAEPLKELGSITRTNSIGWDDENHYTPELSTPVDMQLIGYNVYVASTNDAILSRTNLQKLGLVTTNRWPGTAMGLNGRFAIAVTVVTREVRTNLDNLAAETNIIESDFSEIGSVDLVNGIPIPPNNLQLFTVMQVMATNAIPVLPSPDAVPFPVMPLGTPPASLIRQKNEYELSGR